MTFEKLQIRDITWSDHCGTHTALYDELVSEACSKAPDLFMIQTPKEILSEFGCKTIDEAVEDNNWIIELGEQYGWNTLLYTSFFANFLVPPGSSYAPL